MFDIGWSEMGVIALVALLVLGPKELPGALRTFAYWMKQIRGLAREFQSGVDQLIREAELDEAKKKLEQAARMNVGHEIEKMVDPDRSLQAALKPPLDGAPAAAVPESAGAQDAGAAPAAVPAPPDGQGTPPPAAAERPSAEVTPFPGVAGPVAGAGAAAGLAAVAGGAAPETSDVAEIAASRQAHG